MARPAEEGSWGGRSAGRAVGGDQACSGGQLGGGTRPVGEGSWETVVLDCGIRPKQAVRHPSRGPRLERVQAGLRDTHTRAQISYTGPLSG